MKKHWFVTAAFFAIFSLPTQPALAISPAEDFQMPTEINSALSDQPQVSLEGEPASQEDQERDQEVNQIRDLLKADELNRTNAIRDSLREENLADLAAGHEDLELAMEEKNVDLHLGKNLTDMHGNRVRMEEYVLRPAPNQVQLLNLTMREQRLDYIKYLATFNTTVPQSTRGLWRKEFGRTAPDVYLTQEDLTYSNLSDSIALSEKFFDPQFDALLMRWVLPAREGTMRVNQILKWGKERNTPTQTTWTDVPGAVGVDTYKITPLNHNLFAWQHVWTWKDGTQTVLETQLIDSQGMVKSLTSWSDLIYWLGHLSDLVFNSYAEWIWTATEFGTRNIDTVSQFTVLIRFLVNDDRGWR